MRAQARSAPAAKMTLNYASADKLRAPAAWHALCARIAVALGLVAALAALALVTVRSETIEMDAVSGSKRVRTEWPLGIRPAPRVQASALDLRLKAMGVQWAPDWCALTTKGYSAAGLQTYRGCSPAPGIYFGPIFPSQVRPRR